MEEPDISKMSPEQVEELQRKNCVFCHIAAGKVPAKKVYEDNECVAVLDINPANQGHMLLMPKEHYTVMFQVPEVLLGHIFIIAKGLSQAGLKAFQSKGTTVFAANGVAAGQRAPHFMLHIIPRNQGDSVGLYIPARAFPEKEAAQIAAALSKILGGTKEEKKEAEAEAAAVKHTGKGSGNEEKQKDTNEKIVDAEVVKEERANLDSLTQFLTQGSGNDSTKGGGK